MITLTSPSTFHKSLKRNLGFCPNPPNNTTWKEVGNRLNGKTIFAASIAIFIVLSTVYIQFTTQPYQSQVTPQPTSQTQNSIPAQNQVQPQQIPLSPDNQMEALNVWYGK